MNGVLLQGLLPVPADVLVVLAIVALAFGLFLTEPVPVDVTAILVVVLLIVFEPWTQISPADGLAGFSSEATITVLAMFVLSDGVRRSGAIQLLGDWIVRVAGADERRQLVSVVSVSGVTSGFLNNTPVVAMLIPLTEDVARRTGTSPSRLLIPISYAAMFGGMLTLIGTSTSLLASALSARLIDRPFGLFEFTHLGALVLLTGGVYLVLVGPYLLPARVRSERNLTTQYETGPYLTEVVVGADSELVGDTVERALGDGAPAVEVVQLVRDDEPVAEPLADRRLRPGDALVLRAPRDAVLELVDAAAVTIASLEERDETVRGAHSPSADVLAEIVVTPRRGIPGETISSARLREQYDASVLAIRRGDAVLRGPLEQYELRGGDSLLLLAPERGLESLQESRDFVLVRRRERSQFRTDRIPHALAIVGTVVAIAATGLYPIHVPALAGVVAMVVAGCLRPGELYEAVDWSVILLIAGVIPLGVALERTGGAALLATAVGDAFGSAPPIVLLGALYLLTTLLTEVVSNNASVVLMLPVAVDVARDVDANAFAFVLAVTFAASTSVLTPIGYQTNLMVYGAGGYEFGDFFRVGAPLQALLAVVTTLGIAAFWGL